MNDWHPWNGTKGVLAHSLVGFVVFLVIAVVKDYILVAFLASGYAFTGGLAVERFFQERNKK